MYYDNIIKYLEQKQSDKIKLRNFSLKIFILTFLIFIKYEYIIPGGVTRVLFEDMRVFIDLCFALDQSN